MPTVGARPVLIGLVTAVWVASIIASLISSTYEPDPSINGVFSAVIGAVLAAGRTKP